MSPNAVGLTACVPLPIYDPGRRGERRNKVPFRERLSNAWSSQRHLRALIG